MFGITNTFCNTVQINFTIKFVKGIKQQVFKKSFDGRTVSTSINYGHICACAKKKSEARKGNVAEYSKCLT